MDSAITAAAAFPPGEYLRDELDERGWTEAEFAQIIERPVQAVSEILNGKKEITAETALAIADALGTSAELWLNLQGAYRLHAVRSVRPDETPVKRRARLRSLVPVREIQRRGWLPDTDDLDLLEAAVCDLLRIGTPSEQPQFAAAARRTNAHTAFTPEQVAWIARVSQLGSRRKVAARVDRASLRAFAATLAGRIHDPTDLGSLRQLLAEQGVILVAELPLRSSKIDGVVLFSGDGTPIIGLSTRGDRMDSVLFTLLHEIAHLVLGHVAPGQVQLDEDLLAADDPSNTESSANRLAAEWIFPRGLDAGPGRPTLPMVLALARVHGVHPSFVIGRLQRDGVLGWGDHRRSIPKVRPFLGLG